MNLSSLFHCLTLSFVVALAATGCGESTPLSTERSADLSASASAPEAVADISDPSALGEDDFEALRQRRADFVAELLSYRPVPGRDRAPHYTQPAWSEPDAATVIAHLLRDTSLPAAERAALAQRLRTNNGDWTGAALAFLQTDTSEQVRAALMASLAHAAPAAISQASVLGLADTSPMVRDWATFGASRVLANHPDAPGKAALIDALLTRVNDDDQQVRAGTFRALGFAKAPEVLDHLASGLRDHDARVRLSALSAIQIAAPSKVIELAKAAGLADDEDARVVRAFERLHRE